MEKQKLHGGMFITATDVQLITGTSCMNTARREHRRIRDSLGKCKGRLSIKAYCDYWEIDLQETLDFLRNNR